MALDWPSGLSPEADSVDLQIDQNEGHYRDLGPAVSLWF